MTLAERYDALFIDLDGVVYRGDQAIPAAINVLPKLRRSGLLFLTNNSARTPDQVAEKLGGMGVQAEPKEILTSALATAALLRREGAAGRTAFVIGERGVREALQAATDKFVRRFNLLEDELTKRGKKLGDVGLAELDAIWDEIKKR